MEEKEELIEDENKQEDDVKEATGSETKVKDDQDLDEKEEARRADAEAERAEAAAEADQAAKEEQKYQNENEDTKK